MTISPSVLPSDRRGMLLGLVRNWNWKTALLSALVRTLIFFAPRLWGGHPVLPLALLIETVYAVVVSGLYGSLTQTYCYAEPRVLVTWMLLAGIAASNQLFEVALRRMLDLPLELLPMGLAFSMTVASTSMTIAMMRRGHLLVGRA